MTEVPGTDRDQARENLMEETPLVPESVEGVDDGPRSADQDDDQAAENAKPTPGSTEPGGA